MHYPRTPHLPWSPGAASDDVRAGDLAGLRGRSGPARLSPGTRSASAAPRRGAARLAEIAGGWRGGLRGMGVDWAAGGTVPALR
ncbi:hypothetical protein [Streptomyces sp. CMB-StM0423]|uniref:hypothetical protein n=1 Tax=Streptomyces sp. CMB-StM0423 TaxID=2059884 RepID=UPI0018FEDF88|nr:hypothetical protein [Streptomyces sp. CMB-StM0423]